MADEDSEYQEIDVPAGSEGETLSIMDALSSVKEEGISAAEAGEAEEDKPDADETDDVTTLSSEAEPEDTEKAADQALETAEDETTDDFLTPEERTEYDDLSLKRKQDFLQSKIKSSDKHFTEKSQQLAEQSRALEAREQQLEELLQHRTAFNADPDGYLKRMAEARGLTLSRGEQPLTTSQNGTDPAPSRQSIQADLEQAGLQHLVPVFKNLVTKEEVQEMMNPIQEQFRKQSAQTFQTEFDSAVVDMDTRFGKTWRDKTEQIQALTQQWPRGPGLSMGDYFAGLYQHITGPAQTKKSAATAAARTLKKVAKSEASAESLPTTQGVASKTVVKKPPETIRDAFDEARRELGGRR